MFIAMAMDGVVVLEEMLDRERSCTVEDTERPSRGGKMSSSSDGSSSCAEDEVPLTSTVGGC